MTRLVISALILLATLGQFTRALADQAAAPSPAPDAPPRMQVFAPPADGGPVVVRARFDLHDINEINDETETFEFSGVMTLTWLDPRQAFDPAIEGVAEKFYVGEFQFNEVSPGWYPQLVLVNESGLYQKSGVVLRVLPDGTCTLVETLNAAAETKLNMRRFPYDTQRLEAVFEVLGFDRNEVLLEASPVAPAPAGHVFQVPQWAVEAVHSSVRVRPAPYAGRAGEASSFVMTVEVRRESFYVRRLIVIPLVFIVLLSFSVFWMDRSSLGERLSVSFIGILTGVAYQIVMSQSLPKIGYVTLMHGFLNLSFLIMCGAVLVNLIVGSLDKRGHAEAGDRLDRRCRWAFPLVYFGLILTMLATAFTIW